MLRKIKETLSLKLNLTPTKLKILKNVYWAFIGKIAGMAAQLLVGILIARYLGPSKYGLMNYIMSYVAIFGVISEFGLSNIEIRELSSSPEKRNSILGSAFGVRLLLTSIAYMSIIASLLVFKVDRFSCMMILAYALSLFASPFTVIRNYFTSIIQNEYVVKTELIRIILGSLIKVALLLIVAPLEYFILAVAFDAVIVASGYVYNYHQKVGKLRDWKFQKSDAKYLVIQGFPLLLSSAAIIVYNKIDQVMIGNMLDNAEVGYYATAEKFLSLILFLPGVLVQTVTPLLVNKYKNDYEGYLTMRQQFVNIVVWSTILISSFISSFSYLLVSLTFGSEYLAAVPVLQIVSWKTVGNAIYDSSGQLIILEKKQKWAAIRNVIGCFVNIVLNLILIPLYGIVGSAFVAVVTIFSSGFFANSIIPPYRGIFKVQMKSLLYGWKDIFRVKSLIIK